MGRNNFLESPKVEVLTDLLCNNTNNILSRNSILLKRNFIFAVYYFKKTCLENRLTI